MNTVRFIGRHEFKRQLHTYDKHCCALISISDNRHELEEMVELLKSHNHIAVSFQDVDHRDGTHISNTQAKKISQFIMDNEGCDFIVHCFAGISRSAAVAKFINEYYGLEDPVLENYKIYNRLVYGRLQSTLNCISMEEYYRQLEDERHSL